MDRAVAQRVHAQGLQVPYRHRMGSPRDLQAWVMVVVPDACQRRHGRPEYAVSIRRH
jgi:hypothetical protein